MDFFVFVRVHAPAKITLSIKIGYVQVQSELRISYLTSYNNKTLILTIKIIELLTNTIIIHIMNYYIKFLQKLIRKRE